MIPNAPLPVFEYVDCITIVILTLVLGALLLVHRKQHGNLQASISQTVAATKRSSMLFTLTMLVVYPLYYAWLWLWVGPALGMPTAYYLLLGLSAIAEFVFVLVPASIGWRLRAHQIAAGIVGVAMAMFPAIMLVAGEGVSAAGRLALVIFYVVTVCMLGLLFTPKYRRHTFLYEVMYCALFLGSVSIAAHTT